MNILTKIESQISLILLFYSLSTMVTAQNNNSVQTSLSLKISAIALIDFSTDGNQMITYSYSTIKPNNVEQIITPAIGDKTWLNYSSIVANGLTNYITVYISSGSLPADVSLNLLIGADVGAGAGKKGITKGQITLSAFPQVIITNIGSCYTGRGIHKGHKLYYKWTNTESYDYSLNYDNGKAIAVTYTISSTE